MQSSKSWPTAIALAGLLGLAPGAARAEAGDAGTVDAPAAVEQKVQEPLEEKVRDLESRLSLIERKLEMLGADSELELAGGDALLSDPQLLYDAAWTEAERRRFHEAYRYYTLLQVFHPDHELTERAFPNAAKIFVREYRANRTRRPDSPWLTSEPYFMFQWLSQYLRGEDFPEDKAQALLLRMPWSFHKRLNEFLTARPGRSRWTVTVREDNGIIETVEGVRIERAPAR